MFSRNSVLFVSSSVISWLNMCMCCVFVSWCCNDVFVQFQYVIDVKQIIRYSVVNCQICVWLLLVVYVFIVVMYVSYVFGLSYCIVVLDVVDGLVMCGLVDSWLLLSVSCSVMYSRNVIFDYCVVVVSMGQCVSVVCRLRLISRNSVMKLSVVLVVQCRFVLRLWWVFVLSVMMLMGLGVIDEVSVNVVIEISMFIRCFYVIC